MKAAEVEETWAALPDAARVLCQDQFKALHKSAMASFLHDQSAFTISSMTSAQTVRAALV